MSRAVRHFCKRNGPSLRNPNRYLKDWFGRSTLASYWKRRWRQVRQPKVMVSYEQLWVLRCYWNENSWLYFISRASQRDQSVPQEHTLDFTKLFILHLSRKVQTPPLFSMAQEWFSTIETIACCAGGGRVDKAGRGVRQDTLKSSLWVCLAKPYKEWKSQRLR